MIKIVLVGSLLICSVPSFSQQQPAGAAAGAVYADSAAPVEARITDLLSRMTVEEKVDAFSTDPAVPRLGVVGTGHVEGLHGLALGGPGHWEGRGNETVIPTTMFPLSRGLARLPERCVPLGPYTWLEEELYGARVRTNGVSVT